MKTKTTSQNKVTKVEKLYIVLSDGEWHSTKELVHRVGHTFSVAKFLLAGYGHRIERRRHITRRFQCQYRLCVD